MWHYDIKFQASDQLGSVGIITTWPYLETPSCDTIPLKLLAITGIKYSLHKIVTNKDFTP
jgi:hypothetical protein